MRIRLDQLEALVWIARLGSFRAAARRLNITQPAISARIRELERQAGMTIFNRAQGRPRVTREGTEVLRFGEQMLRLSESLTAFLSAKQELTGTIRMGVAESFASTHLSALLGLLAVHHPELHVELDIDFSTNLDRKLRAAELDIAFLNAPTADPRVATLPLLETELAWFASPRLLLPKGRLGPRELEKVPVLTNPRQSHLYRTIMEWFGTAGTAPERVNTCNSLAIMTKLTSDGFGVSLLPVALVSSELKRRALRRLQASPGVPNHVISIAYRTDPGSGDLARILDLIKEII